MVRLFFSAFFIQYIVMVKKLPRVCKTKTRDWGLLSLFRLLIYVLMSNFAGSSLVYSDLVYKITRTRDFRNLAVLFSLPWTKNITTTKHEETYPSLLKTFSYFQGPVSPKSQKRFGSEIEYSNRNKKNKSAICMCFRFGPLLRPLANRCVFDENAQRVSVDGRP